MNKTLPGHSSTLLSIVAIVTTSLITCGEISAEQYSVASPSGELKLLFELDSEVPQYSVIYRGKLIIAPSRLGFRLKDAADLDAGFKVVSMGRDSCDRKWIQPWGEKKQIRCTYNELTVTLLQDDALARRLTIVFRVFDDGIGFRYELPEQPNLKEVFVSDELTEFKLAEDSKAWWIPAYQDNRYEYLYQSSPASKLACIHTPATFERSDGICFSIHEAALTDFASMTLSRQRGLALKSDLVPWSDGVKVRTATPLRSPWRTIQIGDGPGDLVTSYLILNLNEPSQLKDTSWIKPGKYAGVWWEMHLGKSTWGSGELHGANTENVKQYIDFAAENGLAGVLVEGWNRGWDGQWTEQGDQFQFTTPYEDYDILELAAYARSQGVYLIGHNETGGAVMNYEQQLADAFSLYQSLGIRAVKTGYVQWGQNIKRVDEHGNEHREWHHGQHMVRHYRKVVEEAAEHQIMLDVHEPIKPTGIRRTYPNMMTCEGARGQEFNAWSEDGGNPPEHETILPFTRLLAGPMDYTPGIFDLLFEKERPDNRVNTTLAKQLALYVVIYSPLQMVPDLPKNYEKHPDAFKFIREVPTDWEETLVLHAKIGDYVTIARKQRDGGQWYLGSITDEQGRVLKTTLSFLDPNVEYVAEIYRDGEGADWQENPYAYEVEEKTVDAATQLEIRLAPGGGQAIRIRPKPR